ncbi:MULTISPECIES: autotransporter domain-containing protein [unclassified Haematospirillum]|uniref:autotransporter outer membrane beta-barrel domain-containing protein n=1 Tax=unclassified Haematospirillum TaxID=2622088 RepID=UPI0014397DF3|nr:MULTISPECIES: autotransporter outer membrane beta-barrel domain-containing protein [unclassified Haematospirillum]NKD55528.1 autotransporter outer membrane beta-barrel domain-containing protein [Haematospirillum sp. H4890]NKD75668.1 autotransporter outer membrane beta-barrel domain-containing protein [Haematospirillum sp. H4485]
MSEIRTNLLATTALAAALSLPGIAYATNCDTDEAFDPNKAGNIEVCVTKARIDGKKRELTDATTKAQNALAKAGITAADYDAVVGEKANTEPLPGLASQVEGFDFHAGWSGTASTQTFTGSPSEAGQEKLPELANAVARTPRNFDAGILVAHPVAFDGGTLKNKATLEGERDTKNREKTNKELNKAQADTQAWLERKLGETASGNLWTAAGLTGQTGTYKQFLAQEKVYRDLAGKSAAPTDTAGYAAVLDALLARNAAIQGQRETPDTAIARLEGEIRTAQAAERRNTALQALKTQDVQDLKARIDGLSGLRVRTGGTAVTFGTLIGANAPALDVIKAEAEAITNGLTTPRTGFTDGSVEARARAVSALLGDSNKKTAVQGTLGKINTAGLTGEFTTVKTDAKTKGATAKILRTTIGTISSDIAALRIALGTAELKDDSNNPLTIGDSTLSALRGTLGTTKAKAVAAVKGVKVDWNETDAIAEDVRSGWAAEEQAAYTVWEKAKALEGSLDATALGERLSAVDNNWAATADNTKLSVLEGYAQDDKVSALSDLADTTEGTWGDVEVLSTGLTGAKLQTGGTVLAGATTTKLADLTTAQIEAEIKRLSGNNNWTDNGQALPDTPSTRLEILTKAYRDLKAIEAKKQDIKDKVAAAGLALGDQPTLGDVRAVLETAETRDKEAVATPSNTLEAQKRTVDVFSKLGNASPTAIINVAEGNGLAGGNKPATLAAIAGYTPGDSTGIDDLQREIDDLQAAINNHSAIQTAHTAKTTLETANAALRSKLVTLGVTLDSKKAAPVEEAEYLQRIANVTIAKAIAHRDIQAAEAAKTVADDADKFPAYGRADAYRTGGTLHLETRDTGVIGKAKGDIYNEEDIFLTGRMDLMKVASKKDIWLKDNELKKFDALKGRLRVENDGAGNFHIKNATADNSGGSIGEASKQVGNVRIDIVTGNTLSYTQFHAKNALFKPTNPDDEATLEITEDASGGIWTVAKGITVDMRGDATGLKKVVGENDGDGTFRFSANLGETKILNTQLGEAGKRLGRVEYSGGTHKREGAGAPSYDYVRDIFIRGNTVFEDNIAVTYSDNVTNEGIHNTKAATTVKGNYTNQGTHNINAAMKVERDYTNDAGSTLNLDNQLDVAGKFESKDGSRINLSAENPNAWIKANSFDFDQTTLNVSGVVNKAIRVFEGTVTEDKLKEIIPKIENNAYNNILDYRMTNKSDGSYLIGSSSSAKTADLVSRSGASATVAKAFASGLAVAEKTGDGDLRQAYEKVVLSGNAADIKLAAEQSTTSSNVAATQAITGASRAAAGAVSTRLAATRGEAQTAGLQQSGIAAGDDTRRNGAWIKVTGGIATQKARNGVAGNRTNTYGATIGLDNKVTETLRLGGALSYAQSDVKGKDSGQSKTDINSYQVALYGSYEPGRYFVEGQLAWAYNTIKTSRRITFGGLNRTANGEYDAHQYSASTAVGMPLHKGAVTLTPKAGMFYSYNSPSSYTETGAEGSNLTINPPSTQILEGSLGGVVAYDHTMRSGAELRPELRAAALYEFLGDDATATAKYAGAGATIQTPGLKPSKLGGTVGAGMGYTTSDGVWEVRADYDAEMRAGYVSHNGMLTGRINF